MLGCGGRWTLGVVVLVPLVTYNEVGGLNSLVGGILAGLFSVCAGEWEGGVKRRNLPHYDVIILCGGCV